MIKKFLAASICFSVLIPFAHAEQLEPLAEDAAKAAEERNIAWNTQPISFEPQRLIDILQSGKINGLEIEDPEGIYKFYKSENFAVFWTKGTGLSAKAEKALRLLKASWEHGLNPENYHVDVLKKIVARGDLEDPVGFEILMSDAVTRYGKDITGMRIPPKAIGEDSRSWLKGMKAEEVLRYLSENGNPEKAFDALIPPGKLYAVLQKELKLLLEDIDKNPGADFKPIPFPGLIYPGKSSSSLPLIRARFDLKPDKKLSPDVYDDKLVKKIQSFQKTNGLKPDGVIGKRTIEALNLGRRDKLVKIVANMERLRWMNPDLPDKYIIVNVPAMTLWAFENEKILFEMPVIVGKPDWPTTSFKTDIDGIRFNPSWYVPPSIKTKDILPELRRDPDALKKKNLQLLYYTSDGAKPVSPRDVDWVNITEADFKNFAMIQNPGDENPLGKIRVLMPNQYNIYLHDTNSPDLFTKDYRALSHGCIRLAEPSRVANFILDRNQDWNQDRLDAILAKSNTIEVSASEKVPVFILYQTIWQDRDGELIFGQDIYGSDKKLVEELSRRHLLPSFIN